MVSSEGVPNQDLVQLVFAVFITIIITINEDVDVEVPWLRNIYSYNLVFSLPQNCC